MIFEVKVNLEKNCRVEMGVEITSEAGKHTGEVNVVAYDYEHVYSGGAEGVINVSEWGWIITF